MTDVSLSSRSSPSPVSLNRSSSTSNASQSPMTIPPPQSPQLMSRSFNPSAISKCSPALPTRRISLVSVTNNPSSTPASPQVPPSPGSSSLGRLTIPNVRDLRSSFYQTRICGQNENLVRIVRAANQGLAYVTPGGKIEVMPQSQQQTAPTTPSSAANAPTSNPHSPNTPTNASTTAANQAATNNVSDVPLRRPHSNSNASASGRRVYVALSVGPSHGRVYFEEKLPWPMLDENAASGANLPSATPTPSKSISPPTESVVVPSTPQTPSSTTTSSNPSNSTPNTPRRENFGQLSVEAQINRQMCFRQLLENLITYLPPLPASLIGPSRQELDLGSSIFSNEFSRSTSVNTSSAGDVIPASTSGGGRLSRRPSGSGLVVEDGWCDGEVVLSVFLLLDTIDVDSKQITFIAPASTRLWDHQLLFQILYKADLSQPTTSSAVTRPIIMTTQHGRSRSNSSAS